MTEKLNPVEALQAAEAAGETPSWETVYRAIHSLDEAFNTLEDDCDLLHVLAHAARETPIHDAHRFRMALQAVADRLDADFKTVAKQHAAACNLAFLRNAAIRGEKAEPA